MTWHQTGANFKDIEERWRYKSELKVQRLIKFLEFMKKAKISKLTLAKYFTIILRSLFEQGRAL